MQPMPVERLFWLFSMMMMIIIPSLMKDLGWYRLRRVLIKMLEKW